MFVSQQHGIALCAQCQRPRVAMPTVKCRNCGYLAIRDPFSPASPATEAYELIRDAGWQNASNGTHGCETLVL